MIARCVVCLAVRPNLVDELPEAERKAGRRFTPILKNKPLICSPQPLEGRERCWSTTYVVVAK